MRILTFILVLAVEIIPAGKAYIKPLQQRDSVLIADQIEYGFTLEGVKQGTEIALQDFSPISNDTLTLVRNWQIDTLSRSRKHSTVDMKASVVFAMFEEGEYELPELYVQRTADGVTDTLAFEGLSLRVTSIAVDTASFQIHDIKPQMRYPVTLDELKPFIFGFQLLALLIITIVCLINSARRKGTPEQRTSEPAYIVALRRLDAFRGEKHWAPEKQKAFYSGVTDTLKYYIGDRYGVNAPEMTTAELFAALKPEDVSDKDLYLRLKDLFESADFVKFAKHVSSDEEISKVLPLAVQFVTSTYQSQLEEEQKKEDVL